MGDTRGVQILQDLDPPRSWRDETPECNSIFAHVLAYICAICSIFAGKLCDQGYLLLSVYDCCLMRESWLTADGSAGDVAYHARSRARSCATLKIVPADPDRATCDLCAGSFRDHQRL